MKNQNIPMKKLFTSLCTLLVSFAAVTARAKTCATSAAVDPQGDAFFAPGLKAPAFLDILAGSFTVCDTLTFTVDVAGSLDALPNAPGSGGVYFWNFGLNTDPSTNPPGFPEPPGGTASTEFLVYAQWDGTAFSGVFLDRRPALTGGSPVQYSIPVSVSGSRIILTVPAALAALVQPLPGASWYCNTGWKIRRCSESEPMPSTSPTSSEGDNPGLSDLLSLLDRGPNQYFKTLNNCPPAGENRRADLLWSRAFPA